MEVQGSLGRQIQGISQQPASVRLPGQCTDAVNMSMDVVEGTLSRPGTHNIAKLIDSGHDNMHIHHYDRGDGIEEYFFLTLPGSLPRIFTKTGQPCDVSVEGDPLAYLSGANNPREDLDFFTIADVTFLLNRKKIVSLRGDKSPKLGSTALVFSAFGQYGTTYKISINDVVAAEYTSKTGGTDTDVDSIRTEYIATQLHEKLQEWSGIGDYSTSRMGTTIVITRNDGASFSVDTTDGAKGKDLVAIKNRVASTDLLPSKAPAGYTVQVWPTGSKPEARYWLKAATAEGNIVNWEETIGEEVSLGFNKSTMPYIIERTGINSGVPSFTIKQGPWEDRRVGDELTNPMPSFVDSDAPQTISNIFMVQNRLCLTAGESCIMSRTSRFFDFFRFTVLSALDTDPIDIFADASEVYALRHACVLDGDTVLFSDKAQFILPGDKALTKATALLRPTTTFEIDSGIHPVVTGESIMFVTEDGAYSGVREFYTDSYADTKKAQPITSHVNKLIEGRVVRMAASSNLNRLFVVSNKNQSQVYVYDWLWQGTDKVQSAWHRWVFQKNSKVRSLFYSGNTLYIIIERGTGSGGVYLEKMEMGDPLLQGTDQIRLDRQGYLQFTWDEPNLEWVSEQLPWLPDDITALECVLQTGDTAYVGGAFTFTFDGSRIRTKFGLGDTSQPVTTVVGLMYSVEFQPTDILIKDARERVSYLDIPTVGIVYLNLDRYPAFSVEVKDRRTGRVREVKASNRIGGMTNNIVGHVQPREGVFSFPLRALSTDVEYRIKVLSPHTFQLRDIEWTGSYNPTRKRV